jgi:hypothetical protein
MKIPHSILILGIAFVPLTSTALIPEDKEAQLWTAHYNTVFKYNMVATGDVIKKHGKSFRVIAWLKECKLDALTNAITSTSDEVRDVTIQYLQKQPDGKALLWDVLAGVMSSVDNYRFGFEETAAGIRATMGDTFCKKATAEANNIL